MEGATHKGRGFIYRRTSYLWLNTSLLLCLFWSSARITALFFFQRIWSTSGAKTAADRRQRYIKSRRVRAQNNVLSTLTSKRWRRWRRRHCRSRRRRRECFVRYPARQRARRKSLEVVQKKFSNRNWNLKSGPSSLLKRKSSSLRRRERKIRTEKQRHVCISEKQFWRCMAIFFVLWVQFDASE